MSDFETNTEKKIRKLNHDSYSRKNSNLWLSNDPEDYIFADEDDDGEFGDKADIYK
jgi:hypothetical protein